MKIFERFAVVVALAMTLGQLFAAETATVSKPRILVRAQPSIHSEILTKLEQGEQVTILDRVAKDKPKEGEPAAWLKIGMPANVPVWVFTPYLNPDHSVKVSRLNLRAGPGENYSVVGRLERGASVKPIRQVEEWTEVETPKDAYGFIAADLVSGANPQLAQNEQPTAKAAPQNDAPPAVTTRALPQDPTPPPVAQDSPRTQPAAPVDLGARQAQQAPPAIQTPPAAETPANAAAPSQTAPPAIQPSSPATAAEPGAEKGRTVRREGVIRSTKNPLAPTYEELVSTETRKTINFLWTGPNGMDLKRFRGKKVVVTGEEGLDPKWPRIPVIEVQSIEPAPDVLSESN
ncbi:MAG TPA: SH3 domain-containing protein [Methylomirabilota bacterium]|nr:SH3 domain-containing protein [Methylomirabilota bacterium]